MLGILVIYTPQQCCATILCRLLHRCLLTPGLLFLDPWGLFCSSTSVWHTYLQVEKEIGEKRLISFHGTGLSVAPNISYHEIAAAMEDPEEVTSYKSYFQFLLVSPSTSDLSIQRFFIFLTGWLFLTQDSLQFCIFIQTHDPSFRFFSIIRSFFFVNISSFDLTQSQI